MDAQKLAKLKAQVRIGGRGTPRRKVKRVSHQEADDSKVQAALQKMNVQTLTGFEQVNLFTTDNKVIHFGRPAVQTAPEYNTFVINGHSTEKDFQEMLPEMIQSMSPDQLEQLRKLSEQLQASQGGAGEAPAEPADDKDIPDLVEGETFDTQVD